MPEEIFEVKRLREDLLTRKSASLIYAARWVMTLFNRDELPDFVEILANGNLECWESVMEVAVDDLKAVQE